MPSDQNRAFHYALLLSLLFHGVLLFAVQQRNVSRASIPPSPIEARLVEPPIAAATATVESPAVAPSATAPAVKPRPAAKPKAKPRVEPPPAEPPVVSSAPPAAPVAEPAPVVPAQPAPQPPAPTARAEPAAPPAAPAAPPPVSDALDPGVIAQYRVQLLGAAPRYKVYPAAARDNSWEGLVVLRMVVAPSGAVASLTVQKSSGYRVLDQQALDMFRKASAAVPVPPALRGREFAVEQLAVNYYFEVKN